jgi:hypothetical protein
MSSGDAVFRRIQSVARSEAAKSGSGAPTQEYLIRHTLESFLDRLARTFHAGDFASKAEFCWPPTGHGARPRTLMPTPSAPASPTIISPRWSGTSPRSTSMTV